MKIDTNTMISITETNHFKNNVPRYLVIDFSEAEKEKAASAEDVLAISERLIQKNRKAYEVLAK